MTRRGTRLVSTFILVSSRVAVAEAQPDLGRLFPREADILIEPSAPTLQRPELPIDVLSGCKPDLSDVRIFDSRGKQVAFLVDRSRGGELKGALRQSVTAVTTKAGHDKDKDGLRFTETYVLSVPPRVRDSTGWELDCETRASHSTCSLSLHTGDGGWRA